MKLSDGMKLTFVRGESFHEMWTAMWRKHQEACRDMHAETQMKRKKALADRADSIYNAIDTAERIYDYSYTH